MDKNRMMINNRYGFPENKRAQDIINQICVERINSFDINNIMCNSDVFNNWKNNNSNWYDIIYNALFYGFQNNYYAIHISEFGDSYYIEVVKIINYTLLKKQNKLTQICVEIDTIELSKTTYKVVIEYNIAEGVPQSTILNLNGSKVNKNILCDFDNNYAKNYLTSFNPKKAGYIPVVIINSSPQQMGLNNFSDIAKLVDMSFNVLPDQLLNAQQKKAKENISESGEISNDVDIAEYQQPTINIDSSNFEGGASKSIYTPSTTNLNDIYTFNQNVELLLKKSLKAMIDDDNDSAQKSILEIGLINKTAYDMLAINKMYFENVFKNVCFILEKMSGISKNINDIIFEIPYSKFVSFIIKSLDNTTLQATKKEVNKDDK
ncbi:hypothetical protein [Spiroplasma endosymbiont of Aspidapion aeneum]|uniref:hypothetical protein n=1 Tax=Spiroplasma endosymbiont of Aspidapion aeneum TaxID=3066276 RepID=UPI00313B1B98